MEQFSWIVGDEDGARKASQSARICNVLGVSLGLLAAAEAVLYYSIVLLIARFYWINNATKKPDR